MPTHVKIVKNDMMVLWKVVSLALAIPRGLSHRPRTPQCHISHAKTINLFIYYELLLHGRERKNNNENDFSGGKATCHSCCMQELRTLKFQIRDHVHLQDFVWKNWGKNRVRNWLGCRSIEPVRSHEIAGFRSSTRILSSIKHTWVAGDAGIIHRICKLTLLRPTCSQAWQSDRNNQFTLFRNGFPTTPRTRWPTVQCSKETAGRPSPSTIDSNMTSNRSFQANIQRSLFKAIYIAWAWGEGTAINISLLITTAIKNEKYWWDLSFESAIAKKLRRF